jgi:hypothetical protein
MILVLLYPPAQMIGETEDVAETAPGKLERTGVPGSSFPFVRFEQLGELTYFNDERGALNLAVRGLGPWTVEHASWTGWRKPTRDEERAWTMHRAAVAGIVAPTGQQAARRVS